MRLIVIAGLVCGVEDRNTLLQESGGKSRAFDLTNGVMGHASRVQKMPLRGSYGPLLRLTTECSSYGGAHRNQPLIYEPFHECLRIFKVWVFPRRAVQPERPASCVR